MTEVKLDLDGLEAGDLIERLRPESGTCAFCGCDPYHYVDNGVGMERVAVTCCEEGIALYQHGDEVLARQVALRVEAAAAIEALLALAREAEGQGWRDIKTAPKDGTKALLLNNECPNDPYIGWWTNDVYTNDGGRGGPAGWFAGEYSDKWGDCPTLEAPDFWRPLPTPPSRTQSGEDA